MVFMILYLANTKFNRYSLIVQSSIVGDCFIREYQSMFIMLANFNKMELRTYKNHCIVIITQLLCLKLCWHDQQDRPLVYSDLLFKYLATCAEYNNKS